MLDENRAGDELQIIALQMIETMKETDYTKKKCHFYKPKGGIT